MSATTTTSVLTIQDHEQFVDEGYVLLPGAIARDVVTRTVEVLNSDASEEVKGEAMRACVSDRLLAAAHELLGEANPVKSFPSFSAARKYEPDKLWGVGAHLDLWHPTPMGELAPLNAFIYLSRVRHHGGAFLFAPGSPRRVRAVMSANSGEAAWGRLSSESEVGGLQEWIADPGDVVLFQHLMVHSASPNVADPNTREAIRLYFSSTRLDPGDTPFDEMSTVQKGSSLRYLRHRFGDAYTVLEPGEGATEPLPCVAHDLIRIGGVVNRFWTEPDEPHVLRRARSVDLAAWETAEPFVANDEPIRAIHFEHRFNPTLTVVSEPSPGETWSRVYESTDLATWRQLATFRDMTVGRPHYANQRFGKDEHAPYSRNGAFGRINYFVLDDRRDRIMWQCGGSREEMGLWGMSNTGLAATAPGEVSDLWVRPLAWENPEPAQLLVADVDGAAHYSISDVIDDFPTPLTPFTSDGEVSRIRLLERGERFSLVTFRRDGRVLWGSIDWVSAPGEVRTLTKTADLRRALQLVGMN